MPLTLDPTARQAPLQQRLESLRARCRRIIILRNGSGVALIGISLVALFGWLDWRFHLPALVRAFALLGTLIGVGFLSVRWVIAPWRRERGLLAMAVRVERKYPELNDSLISAVQFLEMTDDEKFGSQELRQEAIEQAIAYADGVDFNTAVRSRGLKRAVLGLLVTVGGAIAILNAAPALSQTALTRLFVPFGSQQWPAKTTIEFVAPETLPFRMARGDSFDLRVVIRGVVPDRVRVSFWLDGGVPVEQVYIVLKHDPTPNETTFSLRIESNRVPRSFRFRVRANDADTDWQAVSVVPPPALVPRDGRPSPQIDLTFPAYTQLEPMELPDGGSVIEAVCGTRVRIKAAVDRPVSQVSFRFYPEQPRWKAAAFLASLGSDTVIPRLSTFVLGREVWRDVPVQLSSDGMLIDVDFVPFLPGPYVLRIEDETGLGVNRVFDIRIKPDPAPIVEMVRPAAGNDSLSLVPDAEFVLLALARDEEFALRNVFLEYRTKKSDSYRRVDYFNSDAVGRFVPHLPKFLNSPINAAPVPFKRLQVYTLARLLPIRRFANEDGTPLREGDVLTLRIGAEDFDDVYLNKQAGYSREIEIQIVSKASLDAALQLDLARLRNTLLELHDQQRQARSTIRDALKKIDDTGRIPSEDIERIQKAEQSQQLLRARIKGENDGILAQLARMKQTIDDNRLPRSATTERLEAVRADIQRLADEEIDPISPLLEAAIKEREKKTAGAPKAALERVERHQREIEEALHSLLERIEPWSAAGEVRGEARSILSELRKQMDVIDALKHSQTPAMAGSRRDDLPDEMKNQLDRESVRPERTADRIRRMLEKMERVADEKESAIKDKLHQAEVKEAEAKSKEEEAAKRPKGSAAAKLLREEAANRRDDAQNLRDSASALQTELDALRNGMKQAGVADLRKRAQEIAPRIRDNQLEGAQAGLKSIADKLEKMVDALGEKPKPEDNDLLQRKRKEAGDRLEKLIGDQELIQKKIDAAKQLTDSPRRAEELMKLSREQERLRIEALDLAQQLSRAAAENEAQDLRRAAREMDDAREQLDQGQSPDKKVDEALRDLDEAQEHLDKNRGTTDDELQREKLQRTTDQIRALRDRQVTAIDEEKRIHAKVLIDRGWKLSLAKESLPGLIDQQSGLAKELRTLAEKRFGSSPVFSRMLRQSAEAMDESVKRLDARKEDVLDQLEGIGAFDPERESKADVGIRVKQELALKRLDQLLEALKPEKDEPKSSPKKDEPEPKKADPPKQRSSDALPPLAELKALRLLQADVAERTVAFDKAHPDREKLTDEEAADLDSIRRTQIDVADLVQEITATPMMGEQP